MITTIIVLNIIIFILNRVKILPQHKTVSLLAELVMMAVAKAEAEADAKTEAEAMTMT